MPEVRRLPSTAVTQLHRYYAPVRLPNGPPSPGVQVAILAARVSHVARMTLLTCRLHYPGGPDKCACWLLPRQCKPSPYLRRVGVRINAFEACSEFTRVTAHKLARPPQGGLCHGASAKPVAWPSRPSATGANQLLSGWNLPPLVIRAFVAHVNGSLLRHWVNPKMVNGRALELFLVQIVLTIPLSGAKRGAARL